MCYESEEILPLPWDELTVTSKSIIMNILKQRAASDKLTKGTDGTYK